MTCWAEMSCIIRRLMKVVYCCFVSAQRIEGKLPSGRCGVSIG